MIDFGSKGAQAIARATDEYRAGDYESALATLAQATVDEEDYLDLAYLLGLCYARLARWDEALLYLEQVVTQGEDGPRTSQCRMMLAIVYSSTGRSKLAEYELQKLVEASRETTQVCAALGHANWKMGRLEEGLRWYGKALELDADNATALNGYGYLLACAGKDLGTAMKYCRKALDSDPKNPAYADTMGVICLKLGLIEEAADYLKTAARYLSDNEELREHVSMYEKAVLES